MDATDEASGSAEAWTGPTVGELGELVVLERVTARLPTGSPLVGPGDDCAVVAAPDGRFVVTTDMMVHGPDFRWAWSSPEDVGWKAAATNLSDVAAMGAAPSGLVVAIAAPQDTPVAVLEGIADGFRLAVAALAPGCGVVGGDLSTSSAFTLAVTAFGDLQDRSPVLRSGARVGDVLAVAGDLGRAARGLGRLFRSGVDDAGVPSAAAVRANGLDQDPDVGRQRRPVPPITAGVQAARAEATAMLDLSDGLAIDGGRLARASDVTLWLDAEAVPDEVALHGGEDHGLLATFPAGVPLPSGFRRLGVVVARGADDVVLGPAGEVVPTTGWDPYADWDGAAG
ncbi:thiamine-phosphate kinase [Curtobacterium sp. MCBA15_001]|uniref:thiamine-phosphate kinase n=1 Tax=Curtobacterium sp. MCBA15_001 TaxID=1898731 RepID=UPI0008DD5A2A|nr:thiamine-phosphate kinase [Curtobacterium sp. MCBA15_001]OIH93361.1 thiamine-phosphate kinase [Curtobacterium sp. MCBA15_001]